MVYNQSLAVTIAEIIQTWIDAVFEIGNCLEQMEVEKSQMIGKDLETALQEVRIVSEQEKEESFTELSVRCENCLESLKRILIYLEKGEIKKAESKLEFELLPLFRIAYMRFYYLGLVEGDEEREKIFWEEEAVELCKNYYIEQGKQTGSYKYDLTIYVLSYNNLDYTKLCVESILENMPKSIRCELILVNHGSTDGTKEYFESISPEKQVDIKQNALDGFVIAPLIAEGELILNVSNDVVISKNSIDFMYQCMKEDTQVAFIVPLTPNIQNLQARLPKEIRYESLEEFKKITEQYNKRDRRKEESRVRLLCPVYMIRTEYWTNSQKTKTLAEVLLRVGGAMFGDDAMSMTFRRAGYKNILMKDVYCHHFGSKTVGKTGYDFLSGRRKFYKNYQVDAWERGFCWTLALFQKLICDKKDAKKILGINGGLGNDSLKIKEELKERTGNTQVRLINYTMEKRFLADLQGISDEAYFIANWESLLKELEGVYDYILLSGGLEGNPNYQEYLKRFYLYVAKGGVMIVQSSEKSQIDWFERQYEKVERAEGEEFLFCKDKVQTQYFAFCKKE